MKAWLTSCMILSNAALAVTYLGFASQHWWIEPGLADIPGARGGAPVVWFVASIYAVVIVAFVNVGFIAVDLYARFKAQQRRLGIAVLSIPALWAATICVDFLHH